MNPATILYLVNLAMEIINTLVQENDTTDGTLWGEVQGHLGAITKLVDTMDLQIRDDEAAKAATSPPSKPTPRM